VKDDLKYHNNIYILLTDIVLRNMTDEYIIAVDGDWIGKYVKVNSQRVYAVKHYKSLAKAKDALWGIIEKTTKKPSVFEIYRCWGAEPYQREVVYLCTTNTINDYKHSLVFYS
jgi:hypothetical protein